MRVILLNQIFFLGILQHLRGTDLRKWWNIGEINKINSLVTQEWEDCQIERAFVPKSAS
jgi:hypothetical protein